MFDGRWCIAGVAVVSMTVAAAAQQPMVRIRDGQARPVQGPVVAGAFEGTSGGLRDAGCCAELSRFTPARTAWYDQPLASGGTLGTTAFMNPATINSSGTIAFMATINGQDRNQGVFIASSSGVTPIAIGCGGAGGSGDAGTGCGDPTPIGGTFSGFFAGTIHAPAINDAGDVLFFADVTGGASTRGLFLHRAADGQIVKVAAVGDASPVPGGGTLGEVGLGSMNNLGTVVFLAMDSATQNVNILRWEGGVVTVHAKVGDAAPGGGAFSMLGRETLGYADGTFIPGGPVPSINDAGQVAFAAICAGGPVERGVLVTTGGVHEWYARNIDTTPIGGNYIDLAGPVINSAGDIAFFADVRLSASEFNSGWFVGRPGAIRKALVFFDPVPGGECFGLAFSRNPMTPLDDCGRLTLWTNIRQPDMQEREAVVVVEPDGTVTRVLRQGLPVPPGGTVGSMDAWPSINSDRQVVLGCGTPGAPGPAFSAYFVNTGAIAADQDGDGQITPADVAAFVSAWFVSLQGGTLEGDFDGNGAVDPADVGAFVSAWFEAVTQGC